VRFVRLEFERCHDRGENDENGHDELVDELLAQSVRQAKYESNTRQEKFTILTIMEDFVGPIHTRCC
jgi:hypothetical protein